MAVDFRKRRLMELVEGHTVGEMEARLIRCLLQKRRRARRKFTEEFKARAVRLVLREGQTAAQVAGDLGLVESVLHGWVRQAKIDHGMGPPGALTSEEREEVSRLRKENRVLKESGRS